MRSRCQDVSKIILSPDFHGVTRLYHILIWWTLSAAAPPRRICVRTVPARPTSKLRQRPHFFNQPVIFDVALQVLRIKVRTYGAILTHVQLKELSKRCIFKPGNVVHTVGLQSRRKCLLQFWHFFFGRAFTSSVSRAGHSEHGLPRLTGPAFAFGGWHQQDSLKIFPMRIFVIDIVIVFLLLSGHPIRNTIRLRKLHHRMQNLQREPFAATAGEWVRGRVSYIECATSIDESRCRELAIGVRQRFFQHHYCVCLIARRKTPGPAVYSGIRVHDRVHRAMLANLEKFVAWSTCFRPCFLTLNHIQPDISTVPSHCDHISASD